MWSVWQTWKMARWAAGFLGAMLAAVLLAALPAGAAFVAPIDLSKSPAATSQLPAIAVNRAGQVFVAWQEGGDISFARSQPPQASCGGPGAPTFDPPVSLSARFGIQGAVGPAVAVNDSGGVFVAWQALTPGQAFSAVWFSRSTDDGQSFSQPVNLSAAVGPARSPSVAADNPGGVFVAWSGGFFPTEIFLARSTDSGASFGAAANVSGTLSTNSVAPSVAADGTNVYLAWEDGNFPLGALSILYRKFSQGVVDLTTVAAAPATSLSAGPGNTFSPSVAVGDGLVSVAFVSLNGPAVYHRSSPASDGLTFSTPAENVSSGAAPGANRVRVARRNGSALVIWAQRPDVTTTSTDIMYRVLGNGGMAAPAAVAATPGRSANSAAAIGFDDRLLVAWQENANLNDETYFSYSGGSGGGTMIQATVWTKHKVLDLRHLAKGHRGHSDGESDGEHHGGGHFKVFIELPGGMAGDIDPTTLQLNGQPALLAPAKRDDDDDDDEKGKWDDDWAELEDENDNGIPDLKVKFSRSALGAAGQTDAQGNGIYDLAGRTKSGGCFTGKLVVRVRK